MKIIVQPSKFNGKIEANPSKSIMQRVIALGALSNSSLIIENRDNSLDSNAALNIANAIGAKVEIKEDVVFIEPSKNLKDKVWDVGESGLCARMFAPIAGLFEEDITITGKGTLLSRPMNSVVYGLQQLGLEVEHNNYFLPLIIKGKIKNYKLNIDSSSGSQLLTGLLIAFTQADQKSDINVKNLKSKPYIDLTTCVLNGFGAIVSNDNYKHFQIEGNQKLERNKFIIEGDWSGAAFHLVGAAISGNAVITRINPKSKQSDRIIMDVLKEIGAEIKIKHNKIIIEKGELNPFEFDATDSPDLFPPLAVLAAFCSGKSYIKGVSRLKHKESNRFNTIKEEFGKLGIKVEKEGDNMIVYGGKPTGGIVNSHNDHRIAMAMATLGLGATGNIEIQNADCVNKSYPDYFLDYESLGGNVVPT